MAQAEAAFGKSYPASAVKFYQQAAALDPAWYDAKLYSGDAYFRLQDWVNAGVWFQKAIDLDPDRETAYRYWGDALYHSGDSQGARLKYEQGIVAEPYTRVSWNGLQQWANVTHTAGAMPQIKRPEFTTPNGTLQVDPALTTETGDGHASWLVYEQARVAHGARTLNQPIVPGGTDSNGIIHPSGYRHSLAEETESLNAMLADVQKKMDAGTVTAAKLEPSIALLLKLQKDGMLQCWIVLNGADGGIRADYPAYRAAHRELLVAYIDRYIL